MTDPIVREELEAFEAAVGDWVAVYVDPAPQPGADPWRLEAVVGWAIVRIDDATRRRYYGMDGPLPIRVIRPVVGGEYLDWQDDRYLGVYRLADVGESYVRAQLRALCARQQRKVVPQ